ncbi:unnamed protein product [Sympodiomycopsis kandeliae]
MASPDTQNRAAVLRSAKGELEIQHRAIPNPGPKQILVRNYAVAVNPVDWNIQDHAIFVQKYPTVLGSDVAGNVEAIGSDVRRFQIGDRVAGFAQVIANSDPNQGAFQTYTLLDEGATMALPKSVDYDAAASLPMAVATTGAALWIALGLPLPSDAGSLASNQYKGQGMLVWGASSSVGSMAVQFAKRLGFTVFAVAGEQHQDYIKSLGADYVFRRPQGEDDDATVQAVVLASKQSTIPIKYGLDAISNANSQSCSGAILSQAGGRGSKLALTWHPTKVFEQLSDVTPILTVAFMCFTERAEVGKWLLNDYLPRALADKTIVPSPPVRVVPGGLRATQEAWNMNKKGVSGQKLVIHTFCYPSGAPVWGTGHPLILGMDVSTSSLPASGLLQDPSKRISYVLPRPLHTPRTLILPEVGAGRHSNRIGQKGSANPYIAFEPLAQSGQSTRQTTPTASTAQRREYDHPRHALPVAGLAIDPTTALLEDTDTPGSSSEESASPKGLLYTAGRDGLISSWQLGLKMRHRQNPSSSSSRLADQKSGISAATTEEDDDEFTEGDGDSDDEKWILSGGPRKSEHRSASPPSSHEDWKSLPFDQQWEVDPDWLSQRQEARPKVEFRSCVQSHTDWINDILLCNSNQTIISASSDRSVRVWNPHDAKTSLTPATLGSHGDYVKSLTYPTASSQAPTWIASGGLDRRIRLWDVREARKDPIVDIMDSASIYAIHTDSRGGLLAAGTPDRGIRLYDPRSDSKAGPVGRLLGHTDMIRSLLLSKSGRKMLSASSDGTVRLWDVPEQRLIHTYTHHSTSVTALFSSSEDLDIFYSGDRDGYVCKVDSEDCIEPDDGECVVLARSEGPINKLVALDNSFVWTSGRGSSVECWRDVPSKLQRQQWYPIYDEYARESEEYKSQQYDQMAPEPYARKDWTRFSTDTFASQSPHTPSGKFPGAVDEPKPRLQSALKSGSQLGGPYQAQPQPQSDSPLPDSLDTDADMPSAQDATGANNAAAGPAPRVSFSLARLTSPSRQLLRQEAAATQSSPRPPLVPDVNPAATLFGVPFDSLVSLAADGDGLGGPGISTGGVGTGIGSIASGRGSFMHSTNRRPSDGRRGSSFSLGRPSLALERIDSSDVPPAMARLVQLRIASQQAHIRQQHQWELQLQQQQRLQDIEPSADASREQHPQLHHHQSARSASSIRFAPNNVTSGDLAFSPDQNVEGDADESDDTAAQARMAYEERDVAVKALPLAMEPWDTVVGVKGLIRSSVLNDRRHVLTFSTSADGTRSLKPKDFMEKGTAECVVAQPEVAAEEFRRNGPEVALWDIVRGVCVGQFDIAKVLDLGQYGDTPGDLLEKVKERIEGQGAGAPWCSVDTNGGSLNIHLEFPSLLDTEIYLDECDWLNPDQYSRGDQRANLGRWVLRWLFSGFIDAEIAMRNSAHRQTPQDAIGVSDPKSLSDGQLAIERPDLGATRSFQLHLPASKARGSTGENETVTHTIRDASLNREPLTAGNTLALAIAPKTPAIAASNTALLTPSLSTSFPAIASLADQIATSRAEDFGGKSADYFNPRSNADDRASNNAAASPGPVTTPGATRPVTPGSTLAKSGNEAVASPGGGLIGRWGQRFTRSNTTKGTARSKDNGSQNEKAKTPAPEEPASGAAAGTNVSNRAANDPPSVALARAVLARGVTPLPTNEGPELPLASNTAITISSHSSHAAPWEIIYRGLKSSTANDAAVLELACPSWLLEIVLNNRNPMHAERVAATKMTFVLTPWQPPSDVTGETNGTSSPIDASDQDNLLPALPSGDARLTATRWLRVGKAATFICEKLGMVSVSKSRQASIAALSRRPSDDNAGVASKAAIDQGPSKSALGMQALANQQQQQQQKAAIQGSSSQSVWSSSTSLPQQEQLQADDVELLCNGQLLNADLTLAQVARYYSRSGSANPLKLEYRRRIDVSNVVQWTEDYQSQDTQ